MTLTPFAIAWLVTAFAVLGLAGYRKLVSWYEEDDFVHLKECDGPRIAQQADVARRLDRVDKWGEILTVVSVAFGVVLGGIYLYQQWLQTYQNH